MKAFVENYGPTKDVLISIVTGTGRAESFRCFIKSLAINIIPFELIISDFDPPVFRNQFPKIPEMQRLTIIYEEPPLGHIKGYNQMFKRCVGHYTVWFNDDCELELGWDTTAYKWMQKNENRIGAIFFTDPLVPYRVNTWQQVCYPNFGFFTTAIGQKLGWFDESMHMYGGDVGFAVNGYLNDIPTEPIIGCHIKHHRPMGGWQTERHSVKGDDVDKFLKIYRPKYEQIKPFYKKYKNYQVIEE